MTRDAVALALDALAVYRLTRLLVADAISAPLRARLAGSRPATSMTIGAERMLVAKRPRLAAFTTCPWCVSPYVAAVVTACQALAAAVWIYPACVLAFSALAGLLSERS